MTPARYQEIRPQLIAEGASERIIEILDAECSPRKRGARPKVSPERRGDLLDEVFAFYQERRCKRTALAFQVTEDEAEIKFLTRHLVNDEAALARLDEIDKARDAQESQ